jgi:hypothetical protein
VAALTTDQIAALSTQQVTALTTAALATPEHRPGRGAEHRAVAR